jgi:hypothetical protein
MSAGVAESLRRALAQIGVVATEGGRDIELSALRAASAELATCLALIKASAVPGDRAAAEGAAKVRRAIDRLLQPADMPARGARAPATPLTIPMRPAHGSRAATPLPFMARDPDPAPVARRPRTLEWFGAPAVERIAVGASTDDDVARLAVTRPTASAEPEDAMTPAALAAAAAAPDDATAMRAILALAWTGATELAATLLARSREATSPDRACALLFAAVALGSADALEEARARVDAPAGDYVRPILYEALAVAGDGADAERLLRRAARDAADAAGALLAAGHLGSAASVPELSRLRDAAPPGVVDEALRAICGDAPAGHGTPTPAARLLRGKAWSVEAALARLAAPDEPVRARERLALDLAVRSGLRPPARYDATTDAALQARAAESFHAAFTTNPASLGPGRWYYFARPVPKG